MSFSDSMFLFEIVVEHLTSYIPCKEFYIKSKFADLFKLNLKDPNDLGPSKPTRRLKRRITVRDENVKNQKPPVEGKVQSGQSILFTSKIDTLIATMKNYPIEITLYNKDDRKKRLGSVHVPWSPLYIDYLYLLATKVDSPPIVINGGHNVYDDDTSRRIATIVLNIKLTHLRDKLTSYGRSISVPTSTKNTKILYHSMTKAKKYAAAPTLIDPGTIKTVYGGGKRKKKNSNKSKTKNIEPSHVINESQTNPESKADDEIAVESDMNKVEKTLSVLSIQQKQKEIVNSKETKASLLYLVKSYNDFSKKMRDDIVRTKSCSSINRKDFKFSYYIFGDTEKLLRNKVLCVGYFTVENEFTAGGSPKPSSTNSVSKSASSPKEDTSVDCDCRDESRGPFRICDKDCTKRKEDDTCISKPCMDDANKISIIQCDKVKCNILEKRKLPLPPDNAIHLDLTSLKQKRLEDLDQAVEKVVGGMKAKMQFDEKSCYCECECTFGFVKRTTYCSVCGGYEKPGEDLSKKVLTGPFPCPVYHKLIDKNKQKSTSGSDRSKMCDSIKGSNKKSKAPATPTVNVESDKEYCRKKKKEKKDDRFKFNYGYTAPQIGHSRCAMPCTGTLNAVPKSMGWLWTADNVPGMKEISRGWRPGAISKRLLSMLNKAKSQQYNVQMSKPSKRAKKRVEEKPTLIVCKRNGEYIVEMQVEPDKSEINVDSCAPLIYKIAPEYNENRILAKERRQRRLIRKAIKEAWPDNFDPDICQRNACFMAYQQAIGLLPYDPNNPDGIRLKNKSDDDLDSCSCDNGDASSECSSLDVDWELHFSPPIACYESNE